MPHGQTEPREVALPKFNNGDFVFVDRGGNWCFRGKVNSSQTYRNEYTYTVDRCSMFAGYTAIIEEEEHRIGWAQIYGQETCSEGQLTAWRAVRL